jgi:hypothetical protein
MNLKTILALVIMMAVPAAAQTAAEQLQKGIFAQESAGKTDEAIAIFRQLANSSLTPRDIAAQAQYRLSVAMLQKGDLSGATREMERLERGFPEQSDLVRMLASRQTHTLASPTPPSYPPAQIEFNPRSFAVVIGPVENITWANPVSWLKVKSEGQQYNVQLLSPNTMYRGGLTRDAFKANDIVTVQGIRAADGSLLALQATTIKNPEGKVIFDRAKLEAAAAAGPSQELWREMERAAAKAQER